MCNTISHEHEVTKKVDHNRHIETTRHNMEAMTALTSGTEFIILEDINIFHEHKLKTVNTQN